MHRRISLSILALLFSVELASALPQKESRQLQTLQREKSVSRLALDFPLGTLAAKLNSYSGKLLIDQKDFTKSQVEIRVNLSDLSIEGEDELGVAAIAPLLRSVPDPIAEFVSSKITQLSVGRYRIDGHWIRRNKRESITFVADIIKSSLQSTSVRLTLVGDLTSASDPFLRSLPAVGRAELDCSLVFSAPT